MVAIGLELPVEIAGEIAAFRASYDPNFRPALVNGGAHLTLKRPDAPLRPVEQVVARLNQLVAEVPAPELEVSGVTVYHSPGGTSTIYLRVQPTPFLLDLHNLLQEGFEDFLAMRAAFEGRYFIPHITLANWLPDRQLEQAIQDLKRMGLLSYRRKFHCPELSLAVCHNDPAFRQWRREVTLILP